MAIHLCEEGVHHGVRLPPLQLIMRDVVMALAEAVVSDLLKCEPSLKRGVSDTLLGVLVQKCLDAVDDRA
jgi:hypothetical protein